MPCNIIFFTKGGVKEKLFSRLSTYYCRSFNIIYSVYCIHRLRTGGGIKEKVGQIYIYL